MSISLVHLFSSGLPLTTGPFCFRVPMQRRESPALYEHVAPASCLSPCTFSTVLAARRRRGFTKAAFPERNVSAMHNVSFHPSIKTREHFQKTLCHHRANVTSMHTVPRLLLRLFSLLYPHSCFTVTRQRLLACGRAYRFVSCVSSNPTLSSSSSIC
jgi:hypothetical protein